MKYGHKEFRKIMSGSIIKLCVENRWFEKGNNAEYDELLNYSEKDNITSDDIVEMANLILEHSDTGYSIEGVMCELARICYSVFEEI